MATLYSQKIETDIPSLNYDAVCFLYNCISDSLTNIGIKKGIKVDISYKMGDINFSTYDFKEFVEKTYGQNPIIYSVTIFGDVNFFVTKDCKKNKESNHYEDFVIIKLSSYKCTALSDVVIEFEKQMKMQKIKSNTNIQQQTIKVTVGGDLYMDGSSIGNGNSIINTKNEAKNEIGFWKGIGQSILSNFIWWALGFIILGILTYIGVR